MRLHLILLLTILIASISKLKAQELEEDRYIKAFVASDTILDGNTFEFRIIIKNLKGDFTPPQLMNFEVVGGPNISSNMQFINGHMTKELSYTYILRAKNIGELYIEESYFDMEGESLETPPIPVLVLDNPEQIRKQYSIEYNSDNSLFSPFQIVPKEDEPAKKKRKLKKI